MNGFFFPVSRCLWVVFLLIGSAGALPPNRSQAQDTRWTEQQLRSDLAAIVSELPQNHKNLFALTSEAEFQTRAGELGAKVPELVRSGSKADWQLELQSLLASVKDGHTNIRLDFNDFDFIPVNFKKLDDGIFIRAAAREHESLLQAKVTKIGDLTAEEVISRLAKLVPHDNRYGLFNTIDMQLNTYQYLTFLGAAKKGHPVRLTAIARNGEEISADLEPYPLSKSRSVRWKSTTQGVQFGMRDRLDFWNDYLKEDKILYFKYNRCRNPVGFQRLVEGTAGFIQQNDVQKFVLDLRSNGGGNSTVFQPLLEYLKNNEELNQRGRLFVIVGRQTYSSAILNAIEMKQQTNAILVGEPTSGKPNHFGEIRSMQLPGTGIRVNYSTKYFRRIEAADPETLLPDLPAPLTSKDWFTGKNRALEVIRKN